MRCEQRDCALIVLYTAWNVIHKSQTPERHNIPVGKVYTKNENRHGRTTLLSK